MESPDVVEGQSLHVKTKSNKVLHTERSGKKSKTSVPVIYDDSDSILLPFDARSILRFDKIPRGFPIALSFLLVICVIFIPLSFMFTNHSEMMADSVASPRIMWHSYNKNTDKWFLVDDYYQSYLWLKNNTPEDARVLAWWDYGYQITGIGNRTSLADGFTYNHEHIGTIGKMLTSPVVEAHSLIRHLADYVYIWSGNNAGDLMKSIHMARIGNSVYRDICPNDPLCNNFGFVNNDYKQPTPSMRQSLLYNLYGDGIVKGVSLDKNLFRQVYSSKYGLVRIFKVLNVSEESKQWIADSSNHVCDLAEKWACRGQYPPAPEIQALLARRVNFSDRNTHEHDEWYAEYHRQYMQKSQRRR